LLPEPPAPDGTWRLIAVSIHVSEKRAASVEELEPQIHSGAMERGIDSRIDLHDLTRVSKGRVSNIHEFRRSSRGLYAIVIGSPGVYCCETQASSRGVPVLGGAQSAPDVLFS